MFFQVTLYLYVAVVTLVIYWLINLRKKNSHPPGPIILPIFGNLFQLITRSKHPAVALQQLADIYGDVMTIKIGRVDTVVVSSHELIKEILKHDSTADRVVPPVIADRNLHKNLGIIWSNGDVWQTTRRFTLRHLRDFGFGKSKSMDVVINEELDKFLEHFRSQLNTTSDNVLNITEIFHLPFLNILWRLVVGNSYTYDNVEIKSLLQLQTEFTQSSNFTFGIPDVFPILRNLFPNLTLKTLQLRAITNLHNYAQNVLEEHKIYSINKKQTRGLMDVFVQKMMEQSNNNSAFTDENCIVTVLDLLSGGAETSSNTMSFGILYMILNPEVQHKVQTEIDLKVEQGQPITLSMKPRLPYTCATVLEILRFSSILPTPSPRCASDDFYFQGHLIKKGTAIITNVLASHFKQSSWGDPYNFRPERFLTDDGTVNPAVAEMVVSFGSGKRACIGQSIAEATLFIIFGTLLQSFEFVKVFGEDPSIEPVPGAIYSSQPYHVKIIERKK